MIETILTEWEDIAEDGGLAARQNGKLLNFGFGVFKEEVVMIIKIHIEDGHLLCTKRVEVAVQDGEVLRRLNQVVTYDFLPEEVVINRSPLFNKASKGPAFDDIRIGDIIQVDDTKLVERTWNGNNYTTYSVTWRFYNR